MDLKVLRYFLTVANTKNITKAADLLHITQPTLSRQLILFERSLGVDLFVKSKRLIALTPEGELLKRRARDILDLADLTEKELTETNTLISGNVTIGFVDSQSSHILFDLIKSFSSSYANVSFSLYSGISEDIINKMNLGFIDICVLLEPVETTHYNVLRLPHYEEWGVLLKGNDPLTRKESIETNDLVCKPLMLPANPPVINEIENWFGRQKYHLNIFGTYNSISIPIQAVNLGLCYGICINNPFIQNLKGLCFRPFNPIKRTQGAILWKKNRNFNSATELFVKNASRYFIQPIY